MKTRVCHITSAHSANDIRIFHKECVSLVEYGYEVHLVATGTLSPDAKGVIHHVLPMSLRFGRLGRTLFRSFHAYRLAKATQATLFHIHDPELLPYALLLKRQGNYVIYDAHEDVPRDVLTKAWIPLYLRPGIAWLIEKIENFIARRIDKVIAATPHICKRFKNVEAHSVEVKNYPKLNEVSSVFSKKRLDSDLPTLCYVGVISQKRGIVEMIKAVETLAARLILAGTFIDSKTEKLVRDLPGWSNVDFRGSVSRQVIADIFSESQIGLCVLHPSVTYIESLPIKLFEYMSAGLPVVSSNFLNWRTIVEQTNSGLCVDPMNVSEIIDAIKWILDNPEEAKKMGENGINAVENNYNWDTEADSLSSVYYQLINPH